MPLHWNPGFRLESFTDASSSRKRLSSCWNTCGLLVARCRTRTSGSRARSCPPRAAATRTRTAMTSPPSSRSAWGRRRRRWGASTSTTLPRSGVSLLPSSSSTRHRKTLGKTVARPCSSRPTTTNIPWYELMRPRNSPETTAVRLFRTGGRRRIDPRLAVDLLNLDLLLWPQLPRCHGSITKTNSDEAISLSEMNTWSSNVRVSPQVMFRKFSFNLVSAFLDKNDSSNTIRNFQRGLVFCYVQV